MRDGLILHGDICWNESLNTVRCVENGYAVCVGGVSEGVYNAVPEKYAGLPVLDFSGQLIMPGMTDLHVHAPQYAFRALGMDLELLDWLQVYTFPEEAKYADPAYAETQYAAFTEDLKKSATTRACIFATVHRDATVRLMDMLEEAGLDTYVGKINMDRDAPDNLREASAYASAFDTFGWINSIAGRYRHTWPILTPRFLPSCSETLLEELHEVQLAYHLPVQSHLSENPGEVELVKKLFPKAAFYGAGYDKYGLFGTEGRTVMAHCVYSTDEEAALMKKNGVFIAHCPASNMNLASGIAPIRRYMNEGMNIGLATDVAGGDSLSMFRAIADAVKVSKLYWRLADQSLPPLTFDEAFGLATLGGGAFFGKAGSFAEGYAFDALVVDDRPLHHGQTLSVHQRLERAVDQNADLTGLKAKLVDGRRIF